MPFDLTYSQLLLAAATANLLAAFLQIAIAIVRARRVRQNLDARPNLEMYLRGRLRIKVEWDLEPRWR